MEKLTRIWRRFKAWRRPTTKYCPKCYCDVLIHLYGSGTKLCADCGVEFKWPLGPGQKPVFETHRKGG